MRLGQVYGRDDRSVASTTRAGLSLIFDAIVPATCLACGAHAEGAARAMGLCRRCCGRLRRWPDATCDGCGRTLAPPVPVGYRCGRCRLRPPAFASLSCVWQYEAPIDAVIRGLKFERLDALGPRLGAWAAREVAHVLPEVTAVTAVPLHPVRRFTRGFDQARLIAQGVAQRLDVPYVTVLRRRRWTPSQHHLPRAQRLVGPQGAFRVAWRASCRRGRAAIARHRWLVVDDVVTTGATLDSACAPLVAAGAPAVHAFACARTPDQT